MIWCYAIKFSIDIRGQELFHIFRRTDKFITIWIHLIRIFTVSMRIIWCLLSPVATYFLPCIFCVIADVLVLCSFMLINVWAKYLFFNWTTPFKSDLVCMFYTSKCRWHGF